MHATIHSISDTPRPFARPLAGVPRMSTPAQPDAMHELDLASMDELVSARRRVKNGEHVYRAGDDFASIYVVRSGFFRSNMTLEDGREQVTGFFLAGDMMGMDGIHGGEHTCDVIALEDSEVCVISYARLQRLSVAMPALQQHFHRMMGREITRDHGIMLLLGSMRAEERLAAFLLNLSTRYVSRGYSGTAFNLRMTREDIGSYLGLTIETVSRALGKLHKLGLISVKNRRVEINDLPALHGVIGCADHEIMAPARRAGVVAMCA
jgi:CRP/FNR family transcriptional regulator, anaerobic regulatory protein